MATATTPEERIRQMTARREAEECHAGKDGDCIWIGCPQNKDGEPEATGRHCPLDALEDPYQ